MWFMNMWFVKFVVIVILIGMFISFIDMVIGFDVTMDWKYTIHQISTMIGGALVLVIVAKREREGV